MGAGGVRARRFRTCNRSDGSRLPAARGGRARAGRTQGGPARARPGRV